MDFLIWLFKMFHEYFNEVAHTVYYFIWSVLLSNFWMEKKKYLEKKSYWIYCNFFFLCKNLRISNTGKTRTETFEVFISILDRVAKILWNKTGVLEVFKFLSHPSYPKLKQIFFPTCFWKTWLWSIGSAYLLLF